MMLLSGNSPPPPGEDLDHLNHPGKYYHTVCVQIMGKIMKDLLCYSQGRMLEDLIGQNYLCVVADVFVLKKHRFRRVVLFIIFFKRTVHPVLDILKGTWFIS